MKLINRLFEAVFYGVDLEFKYNEFYYFINSGKEIEDVSGHKITVTKSKGSCYECDDIGETILIYNVFDADARKNTDDFFCSKVFDGKSLYEISDNITDINY